MRRHPCADWPDCKHARLAPCVRASRARASAASRCVRASATLPRRRARCRILSAMRAPPFPARACRFYGRELHAHAERPAQIESCPAPSSAPADSSAAPRPAARRHAATRLSISTQAPATARLSPRPRKGTRCAVLGGGEREGPLPGKTPIGAQVLRRVLLDAHQHVEPPVAHLPYEGLVQQRLHRVYGPRLILVSGEVQHGLGDSIVKPPRTPRAAPGRPVGSDSSSQDQSKVERSVACRSGALRLTTAAEPLAHAR